MTPTGTDLTVWAVVAGWVTLYVLAALLLWLTAAAIVGVLLGRMVRLRDRQIPAADESASQPSKERT